MWRLLLVGLVMTCGLAAVADEPKPDVKKPPYERLLTGKDAFTVEELNSKAEAAEAADRYEDAVRLHQQLLDLRSTLQGLDHWETVNQRWMLRRVQTLAALPSEKRAGWRNVNSCLGVAQQLDTKEQWPKSEPLYREILRLHR